MTPIYVPDRGDVIWLDFDPQLGHEQIGRRPALVLSGAAYNGLAGLAVVCPITRQAKGYQFELPLPSGLSIHGVVLCDQVKSQDWVACGATFECRVPPIIVVAAAAVIDRMFKS